MGKDELLTTQQAAERLGLTDSRVRQLILEGRLPAQKFGHLNMIREKDLAVVADIKRGRPAKTSKKPKTSKSL
jgi:excisionase family DNA binding protein